jgi:hypothetical protein
LVTLHVADLPIRIIGGALETSSHRFSTREIGHENDFQISQSRQDLIEQAQLTGDWAHYDKRMAAMDRHEARNQQFCPRGTKQWCYKRLRHEECSCVSDANGREMFERLGF